MQSAMDLLLYYCIRPETSHLHPLALFSYFNGPNFEMFHPTNSDLATPLVNYLTRA